MISNIDDFERQMRENVEFIPREMIPEVMQIIALDAQAMIDERSPVLTGRFRGNNLVTTGGTTEATVDRDDPSGAVTRSQGVQTITGYRDPYGSIFVQNNVPYAKRIEDEGHSPQAPQGVYGPTFVALETKYGTLGGIEFIAPEFPNKD